MFETIIDNIFRKKNKVTPECGLFSMKNIVNAIYLSGD